MHAWRTWSWLLPIAALGPALLWASPFGPARDLTSRLQLFAFGYPAWLLLTVIWLGPGVFLAKRLHWNIWYVVPWVAVTVQLAISAVQHWPPNRWWPQIITGQPEVPSGNFLGFPTQAWHGYLYSLWAKAFIAFITAMSLLIAQFFVRPNNRLERQRHE